MFVKSLIYIYIILYTYIIIYKQVSSPPYVYFSRTYTFRWMTEVEVGNEIERDVKISLQCWMKVTNTVRKGYLNSS